MNDKDRQLIEQVLSAAGTAGIQGWEYLVRWQFINGTLSLVGYIALLGACVWMGRRVLAWKTSKAERYDSFAADFAPFAKGVAIVVLVIMAQCAFASAVNSLRDAIAPEGAAIREILKR